MGAYFVEILTFFGGVAATVVTFIIALKKGNSENWQQMYDRVVNDNDKLRSRMEILEKQVAENQEKYALQIEELKQLHLAEQTKNALLANKLILLETAMTDSPLPQWLKSPEGVMLTMNKAYERAMNVKREEYIGKTDIEFWGEKIGKEYQKNDQLAKARNTYIIIKETIKVGEADVSEDWIIMKYPRYYNDVFIGIAGIAFPLKYLGSLLPIP